MPYRSSSDITERNMTSLYHDQKNNIMKKVFEGIKINPITMCGITGIATYVMVRKMAVYHP